MFLNLSHDEMLIMEEDFFDDLQSNHSKYYSPHGIPLTDAIGVTDAVVGQEYLITVDSSNRLIKYKLNFKPPSSNAAPLVISDKSLSE
jgi:hypothetical protein